MKHERVAVLDFGGQYTHLIANRVRRLNVFSEILDPLTPKEELQKYKGIILSGGPMSVYDDASPRCDDELFKLGIPVLGICYGHQLMQYVLGGSVKAEGTKEYGFSDLNTLNNVGIFKDVKPVSRAWMSHGDTVKKLAEGFVEIGKTEDLENSAVADEARHFYGVQFHPEVTHTDEGMKILDNFLDICDVSRDWSIQKFIREEIEVIKTKVGDKKVFLLVSGGVDSTVCFALLKKALGSNRVFGFLVDHGLMRMNEPEKVKKSLDDAGFENLQVIDAKDKFFKALNAVADPETKRKIIGELFWEVKESIAESRKLDPEKWIVAQGTIYPDTIETGGTKHSDTIKTHHNRVDLMVKLIKQGKVVEPIAQLYKDEVRNLGEQLGLPHELVWRHPFPGPGFGVRILCSKEEKEVLLDLKAPFNVLPIKSVGVQGDSRTYRHPALVFKADEKTATNLINLHPEINRVLRAISDVHNVVRLNARCITPKRVQILQQADDIVMRTMHKMNLYGNVWQFPVVLVPISFGGNGEETIILRPVDSIDAMSASVPELPEEFYQKISSEILKDYRISAVLLDITNKPPGTIEWE